MDNKAISRYNSDNDKSVIAREKLDNMAGVLHGRSVRLDSKKKALLRMIVDQGGSYGQVARLSGEHASTVSRRFRAMVRRLRGGTARAADEMLRQLTPLEKTILIESFLYGTGQKAIAAKLGVSRYRVRKVLQPFQDNKQTAARSAIAGMGDRITSNTPAGPSTA
ncbi:MAG: hypothetical protein B6I25_06095 [Planctomycetales bacterium 4572_13]|nr:MAG: hypothetical protein B6I25_06095 [Planctomycetales bacterium 4572_13]